ncbi:MAG: hypothetical protein L0K86_00410 [Actinomycetia bacterium]|nr:hypothetical protein [Actinomycetes bacterium]
MDVTTLMRQAARLNSDRPAVITTEPLPESVGKQLRQPHWAGHERRVSGA